MFGCRFSNKFHLFTLNQKILRCAMPNCFTGSDNEKILLESAAVLGFLDDYSRFNVLSLSIKALVVFATN